MPNPDMLNMFPSRECVICGKKFIITPEWIYKGHRGNRTLYMCSYTCRNRFWDMTSPPKATYGRREV